MTTVPASGSPGCRVGQEETEDTGTRVFTVDAKANKHHIRQAGKKLCDIDVAKLNTLIGPMGRRRGKFDWLLTMMLCMLPTKLGSSKLSPAGQF